MDTQKRYSVEFKERAVRLVDEQVKAGQSQWAAMQSISQKLGCTAETLRRWVRRAERATGRRPELTSDEHEYNFSKAERGKFFRKNSSLELHVYLDAGVRDYWTERAKAKGVDVSDLVNDLLKRDIELIEAPK